MTIILAILIFTFLVLIHELGHFLTARALKVRAYELAIGMGPKIYGTRRNDTDYTLRAIPFGAYVRFGDEEDSLFQEGDNFMNQKPWDRIKIIAMGPIVNIVAALLIMILVTFLIGSPVNKIGELSPDLPASTSGLEVGDTIIEIEGNKIDSWEDVIKQISNHSAGPLTVVAQGVDGEVDTFEITPVESQGRYMVGISPMLEKNFFTAIKDGTTATINMSTMMLDVVKQLFTGQANIDEFSGPVGIVTMVDDAAETGLVNLLYLTAVLSLNLGILNLLPIPALDGSKILIYGFEMVTGKAMNRDLEMRITVIGFTLLMGFTLFITFKDIIRIFG